MEFHSPENNCIIPFFERQSSRHFQFSPWKVLRASNRDAPHAANEERPSPGWWWFWANEGSRRSLEKMKCIRNFSSRKVGSQVLRSSKKRSIELISSLGVELFQTSFDMWEKAYLQATMEYLFPPTSAVWQAISHRCRGANVVRLVRPNKWSWREPPAMNSWRKNVNMNWKLLTWHVQVRDFLEGFLPKKNSSFTPCEKFEPRKDIHQE